MSETMTTPEALNELADRVERDEPSRKLDGKIWIASGQINEGHCAAWCRQAGRTDLTRARYIAAWAPKFTTSLDAAVTLVPEGWIIAHLSEIGGDGLPSCTLTTGSNDETGFCLESPTSGITALARCLTAAALRARAAMERT